jgi:segregation and condensation protein B
MRMQPTSEVEALGNRANEDQIEATTSDDGDAIREHRDGSRAGLSRLESILESLLFAAGAPVTLKRLVQLLDGPSSKEVAASVASLRRGYEESGRGMRLVEVAGGYQFRTAPENASWVRTLLRDKPGRLGRATLETLAIIAYKQPVTRAEIEAIRGVDVEGPLGSLLSKRLIKIEGRKETVGRPLIYGTTSEFLEVFGLKDLNDLPALQELSATDASEETPDPAQSTDPPSEDSQPGGGEFAAGGGASDPGGQDPDQRQGGDGAGNQGGPGA